MYYFENLTLKRTKFVEGITLFDTNSLILRFFGIYTLVEAGKCEAKLFFKCQCCMQWVALADAEGSSDFFRNYNTPEVINSSDNASSLHSISFSFSRRERPMCRSCFVLQCGTAHRPFPTIILQITMLLFVKGEDLYWRYLLFNTIML